uniref:Uncharacterized protein n=1 Tax=Romanomermis culicivorax TaxID=13658 RepID=A0A915HUM7_ROMCU
MIIFKPALISPLVHKAHMDKAVSVTMTVLIAAIRTPMSIPACPATQPKPSPDCYDQSEERATANAGD